MEKQMFNGMQENFEYSDIYGQPAVLTDDEIGWFRQVCSICRKATGIHVPIIAYDHELLHGKSKEAYATTYSDNPEAPLDGNVFVSVDTYFIHECFEEKFHGTLNISFESLEHVIAHELAHTIQWRHCKRHTAITEELYGKIMAYESEQDVP